MSSAVVTDVTTGRRMDVGRLVVVPVMAFLAWMNIETLVSSPSPTPHAGDAGALVHGILVTGFYLMIVGFYLVRRQARSTTPSIAARVLAVVATFTPFFLPLLTRPVADVTTLVVPSLLLFAGMAWSLWSLRHLGRNVSIVAQSRGLTRSGPYRLVRHPLYLGEFVATIGIVLAGFTWAALAVLAVLATLQIYRSVKEEEVLLEAFPEYADYRLTTARLVPGLF